MKREIKILLTAVFLIFVTAIAADCSGESGAAKVALTSAGEPRVTRTVVLSGLREPWDLAFTPDGAMLFTEKCRGLSVRLPNGAIKRLFGTTGSAVVAGDLFSRVRAGCSVSPSTQDFPTTDLSMSSWPRISTIGKQIAL